MGGINWGKTHTMTTNMYSDLSERNELEIGALDCARRGWRVVPLHPASSCGRKKCKDICKHSLNRNGLDDATLNEQTIHQWWQKWPNANVGVATGEHSGVVVLEVHPDQGGNRSLSFLEEILEELRDTVEIVTEEGTRLLLFSYPDDGQVVTSGTHAGKALVLEGNGGLFVAPPSRNGRGQPYRWHSDENLPPLGHELTLARMPSWCWIFS